MKWIVWILLVTNLAVAAFFLSRSHWPQAATGKTMPLNVERISLDRSSGPRLNDDMPPVSLRAAALCVEWSGLNSDEFRQAREQLKALVSETVMSFSEVPLSTRNWLIFPPLPAEQAAVAKLNELLAAGVQDAFVVKDGPWRHAISLGLYANDEAARRRVREIEEKGVLGTRIELLPRQGTGYYFVIRSEDLEALKNLGELRQAYPNSQQSRVACRS